MLKSSWTTCSFTKGNIVAVKYSRNTREAAESEIKLWFKKEELHSYTTVHEKHVF